MGRMDNKKEKCGMKAKYPTTKRGEEKQAEWKLRVNVSGGHIHTHKKKRKEREERDRRGERMRAHKHSNVCKQTNVKRKKKKIRHTV